MGDPPTFPRRAACSLAIISIKFVEPRFLALLRALRFLQWPQSKQIDLRVRHASRAKNKGAWDLPTLLGEQTPRKFRIQDSFLAIYLIGL
jgi:hypothetical protein